VRHHNTQILYIIPTSSGIYIIEREKLHHVYSHTHITEHYFTYRRRYLLVVSSVYIIHCIYEYIIGEEEGDVIYYMM